MKKSRTKRWITLLLSGLAVLFFGAQVMLFGGVVFTESADAQEKVSVAQMTLKLAFFLGLVLVLIYLTVLFLKRFAYPGRMAGGAGAAEILQVVPLLAKKNLFVVRLVDRILVLGVSESGIAAIAEITDPETVERWENSLKPQAAKSKFAQQLEKVFRTAGASYVRT